MKRISQNPDMIGLGETAVHDRSVQRNTKSDCEFGEQHDERFTLELLPGVPSYNAERDPALRQPS